MPQIYLVRHGQASFGADDYDQLSDIGYRQSTYLGQYFRDRNISFDHVFAGTLKRQQQTMTGILQEIDASETFVLPELNEYDFKRIYKLYMAKHEQSKARLSQGSKNTDQSVFYKRLKIAMKLWSEGHLQADGLETWDDFTGRTLKALTHIQENATGNVLIVSSGGVISMMMGHILGLNVEKIIDLNLQIKNTSFCHIFFGGETMKLSNFNAIPHLDQADRMTYITYS